MILFDCDFLKERNMPQRLNFSGIPKDLPQDQMWRTVISAGDSEHYAWSWAASD